MAMFREHISGGALVAVACVTVVYFYALVTNPMLLLLLVGASTVASFLPDLDSDSGLPFHLIFGTFTLACGGLALLYTLQTGPDNWYVLTGVPLITLIFVWFIVGGIFKQFTTHRGMMHSVPAMIVSGLGTFLLARYFGLEDVESLVFGLVVMAGYLTHLILDELYSYVDVQGLPFIPKRSAGSALKFFSYSTKITIGTYALIAWLVYIVMQDPAVPVLVETVESWIEYFQS